MGLQLEFCMVHLELPLLKANPQHGSGQMRSPSRGLGVVGRTVIWGFAAIGLAVSCSFLLPLDSPCGVSDIQSDSTCALSGYP